MIDRTEELVHIVTTLRSSQSRRGPSRTAIPPAQRPPPIIPNFTKLARNLNQDAREIEGELKDFRTLATKKSLFDTQPVVIQEMTYMIKTKIDSLNQNISKLENVVTSQISGRRRTQQQTHARNVVMSLEGKLKTISSEFKRILEIRTENLKKQRELRGQFSDASSRPYTTNTSLSSSLMDADESESTALMIDMTHQEMEMATRNDTYIQERADAMEAIERTINELGSVFSRIATVIQEQGEQIQRIDTNIAHTEINVEQANTELMKYLKSVSSNRMLMLKVFGVLIAFFLFFVIVIA